MTEIAAETRAGGVAGARKPALLFAGFLVLAGMWTVDVLAAEGARPALSLTVDAVGLGLTVGFGLHRLWRRRDDRPGVLLVAAGVLWWITTLARSDDATLYSLARISAWFLEVAIVYLLLAFPFGRLGGTTERRLFGAAAAIAGLLYLPTVFIAEFPVPSPWSDCVGHCPHNVFALGHGAETFVTDVVRPIRELLTALLFGAVSAVLIRRARVGPSVMRHAVTPVAAVSAFRTVALALYTVLRAAGERSGVTDVVGWIYAVSLPMIALSVMAGLLGRRLFVARALNQLANGLAPHATPADLRATVAGALEDPALSIVYWLPGAPGTWVDQDGAPAAPPCVREGRSLTELSLDGRRIAAIDYDVALSQDPSLVRAATSYALTALENDRLAGQLRASLEELARSRARIVAVSDRDRRRIERDLHDGAQQRLVALRVRLGLVAERVAGDSPASADAIRGLEGEVDQTIDEVRSFARGVYPSLLAERGLTEALRAAGGSASVPTSVHASHLGRYAPEIEATVYFSCIEALQNAAKHASGASAVTISVVPHPHLRFEVCDDGPGFDPNDTNGGVGLTNLRDRLAAVGGELTIDSAPGAGTRIGGVIPDARPVSPEPR